MPLVWSDGTAAGWPHSSPPDAPLQTIFGDIALWRDAVAAKVQVHLAGCVPEKARSEGGRASGARPSRPGVMMARLGIGLIGVGAHGHRYARHIARDLPSLRLVALARRNLELARRQAGEFGCRAYGDYRELIAAPDVEAIVVVVPPTLHADIIHAAAAARRPVLLEKPAAPDLTVGRQMLHTVRAANIPVMVAQTLRYNSVVRLLMEQRSRVGRIHAMRFSQHFEPSRPSWIDDPAVAGGGVTLHTGVHNFDLARLLSGLEAERVSCEMSSVLTARTEDNFSAVIRFRGAVVASVNGSRATASRCGSIELTGQHGQLTADHVCNTVHVIHGSVVAELPVPPAVPTVREVLRDFATALRRGRAMPISLEEGLRAVAIVEACYRAAQGGQAVAVPPLL
ncbi:MAG: Gfo/Idh/MocA family protein [Candidatus Binatia bacterium]